MSRCLVPDFWPYSSDYFHTSGRARQVRRVHIKAPDEAFPRRSGHIPQAFCGVAAYDVTDSPKITHAPDQPLPAGLSWCPKCLGIAAVHLGAGPQVEHIVTERLTKRLRSVPTAEQLLAMPDGGPR